MSNIEAVCHHLSEVLKDKIALPGHDDYAALKSSYFSLQAQEPSPACVVRPSSVKDVVTAIKALVAHDVPFAVKGGGHSLNAGAANIEAGVTIDLRGSNKMSLNEDQSVACIGAGTKWVEVYSYLDEFGLVVAGGRVGDVGVAGLTLGGGLSFFSGTRGLVCDNVENFEIVLASGEVVNANSSENRDLWIALKGGSGNFGIVTRFDLRTWRQGNFNGGVVVSDISTADAQLQALADQTANYDPHLAIILSLSWDQTKQSSIIFSNLQYSTDDDNPPALQPFTQVQPQFFSTMRISNLTDFAIETGKYSRPGTRNQFATTTVGVNLALLREIYQIWQDSISSVSSIEGVNWPIVLQPLPSIFHQAGGGEDGQSNSLGFPPSGGSHILVLLAYSWEKKDDDAAVTAAAQKLIGDIDAASTRAGLFCPFKYLNYSAGWQDPIAGYGEEGVQHLQTVSRKYDPQGVFQRQCPGGFKISKAAS